MTLNEYKTKLSELSDEEFQKFNNVFGGGQLTIEQRVREFAGDQKHEHSICHLLGLDTEAEKLTTAALKSANAALQSANSAKLSMIFAAISCIGTIIFAAIGLWRKCG